MYCPRRPKGRSREENIKGLSIMNFQLPCTRMNIIDLYTFPFQLDEIRRVKLSRVICDNSDKIEDIQVWLFDWLIVYLTVKIHPGVRHGPSRPRDQPKGSLQLQPPAKDWSDQVKYILGN